MELRDFQRQAVDQIKKKKKCIFSNPTGTGKTHAIIPTLLKELDLSANLFCPLAIKKDWVDIIAKHNLDCDVYHFEQLLKIKVKPKSIFILDEAQFLKNYTAKRSRAMIEIAKRSEYVVLVSATPSITRPLDWQWLLNLTHPNFNMTRINFKFRFCKQEYDFRVGRMIFKDEIVNDEKGKELLSLINDVTVKTKENNFCKVNFHHLRPPEMVGAVLAGIEDQFYKVKYSYQKKDKLYCQCLFKWLLDAHEDIFNNSLVFATSVDVVDLVADHFDAYKVTSKIGNKHKTIESWKNCKTNKPFVVSYGTASVGLNLDKSGVNKVILLQSTFSQKSELQALSRLTRWDRVDSVDVYRVESNSPFERTYQKKLEYYFKVLEGSNVA